MEKILPGDVVIVFGRSLFSRLIAWATRSKGEEKTRATHIGIAINCSEFMEATWTACVSKFAGQTSSFEVWRLIKATKPQRQRIVDRAMDYFGRRYGVTKIVTAALDSFLSKLTGGDKFFFRRLNHNDTWPICSWLAAFSYFKAFPGFKFKGVDPRACTPDDIHDHVIKSTDWRKVEI